MLKFCQFLIPLAHIQILITLKQFDNYSHFIILVRDVISAVLNIFTILAHFKIWTVLCNFDNLNYSEIFTILTTLDIFSF